MARPWSRPSTKARSSYLSSLSSVLFCHAHVNGHSEIIGRSGISTPPLRDAGPPRANAVLVTVRRFTLLSRAVPGPSTIHTHIPVYERVRFQVDSTEAEKSREERNGRYEIQKYAQLRPATLAFTGPWTPTTPVPLSARLRGCIPKHPSPRNQKLFSAGDLTQTC